MERDVTGCDRSGTQGRTEVKVYVNDQSYDYIDLLYIYIYNNNTLLRSYELGAV